MRDYKTTSYEKEKPDINVIILATIFIFMLFEFAWDEIFNYFGF